MGIPHSRAYACAPLPTSRTWGLSNTLRASEMGFLMSSTHATAPTSSVCPSMMPASSSIFSSLVRQAPVPALYWGLSSSESTDASTASSAEPPACKMRHPIRAASLQPSWTISARSGVTVPAPPWTIRGIGSALHNLRLLQGGGSTHSVLNNLGLLAYSANSVLHSLGLLCCSTNSALHNLAHSRHTLVECLPNLWQVRCGIHSASHYLMQGGDTFAKGFLNLWQVRCRTNHIVHNLMYSRYTLVERLP